MIKGRVTCRCGQMFGYETTLETVACPSCKLNYTAADYAEPEPVEVVEDDIQL